MEQLKELFLGLVLDLGFEDWTDSVLGAFDWGALVVFVVGLASLIWNHSTLGRLIFWRLRGWKFVKPKGTWVKTQELKTKRSKLFETIIARMKAGLTNDPIQVVFKSDRNESYSFRSRLSCLARFWSSDGRHNKWIVISFIGGKIHEINLHVYPSNFAGFDLHSINTSLRLQIVDCLKFLEPGELAQLNKELFGYRALPSLTWVDGALQHYVDLQVRIKLNAEAATKAAAASMIGI